jgi:hypothetical protein
MSASRAATALALLALIVLAAAASAAAFAVTPPAGAASRVADDGLEACTLILTII